MEQENESNYRSVSDREMIEIINIPGFWESVRQAHHKFLGLDYDGTLAPFRVDPMEAKPLEGITSLLIELSGVTDTTLAIISGRPVREVMILVGNLNIFFVGSHGFELRHPSGQIDRRYPSPKQQKGLDVARGTGTQLGLSEKLEIKPASIALHTRGMPSRQATRTEMTIFDEWSGISGHYDLEVRRFDGGVEIRSSGWHKGKIVEQLLSMEPPDALPVYIGDDETDEDAFRVMCGRGFGIKVGNNARVTLARGILPDCGAVKQFLETWLSMATKS